jgi:hypothetical protein
MKGDKTGGRMLLGYGKFRHILYFEMFIIDNFFRKIRTEFSCTELLYVENA